jgi:hypothetical protein
VFRELAIARILEPISKADAGRVLADLGATVVSYKTIQRDLAMKTSASTGTPSPASASRMPLIAVD